MRGLETLVAASLAMALWGAIGCGKSSDTTASSQQAAGSGGGTKNGMQNRSAGSASTEPLADQTAGNACSADKECANGLCLMSLPGSFGGPAMDAPDGYCSAPCATNADCGEGGACSGAFPAIGGGSPMPGRCMKSCASADDCRKGYRCVNGLGMTASASPSPMQGPMQGSMLDLSALLGPNTCQPIPATVQLADGVTGEPCQQDTDCGKGRCLKSEGMMTYAGGYCSGSCLQDKECGDNGTCTQPIAGGGAGSCYRSCQSHGDSDCREGYRCRTNGSRRQCLPGAPPLGDHIAGSACTSNTDCGGDGTSCLTTVGKEVAPGGYCSQSCTENSDCGEGGTCVGGLGSAFSGLLGVSGTCYRACPDPSSCRKGYACGQPSNSDPATAALGGMPAGEVCIVASAVEQDAGVP